MKNLILIIPAICILFVSCKKDRDCTCTVTASGNVTTRSQMAASTISLNLIPGFPVPPIEISPAKDVTSSAPYNYVNNKKTSYDKIRKGAMKKVCQESFEESVYNTYTSVNPGTSTVTTTDEGKKVYSCQIE